MSADLRPIPVRATDLEALGVSLVFIVTDSPERKAEALRNSRRIAVADEMFEVLCVARNYIEATTLNASSPRTRENYGACLRRIDAVIAKVQEGGAA